MAFFQGKRATISFDDPNDPNKVYQLPMTEWSLSIEQETFDTSNFNDKGYSSFETGAVKISVNTKGPFTGETYLTKGKTVWVTLNCVGIETFGNPGEATEVEIGKIYGEAVVNSFEVKTSVSGTVEVVYSLSGTRQWEINPAVLTDPDPISF